MLSLLALVLAVGEPLPPVDVALHGLSPADVRSIYRDAVGATSSPCDGCDMVGEVELLDTEGVCPSIVFGPLSGTQLFNLACWWENAPNDVIAKADSLEVHSSSYHGTCENVGDVQHPDCVVLDGCYASIEVVIFSDVYPIRACLETETTTAGEGSTSQGTPCLETQTSTGSVPSITLRLSAQMDLESCGDTLNQVWQLQHQDANGDWIDFGRVKIRFQCYDC